MSESSDLEGLSLLDLAGIDTSGIEAKRIGEILPRCLADFECIGAELGEIKDGDVVKMFKAEFKFKPLGIHMVIDKDVKEEDILKMVHTETRMIKNQEGLQYLIGFLEDIGVKQKGVLSVLMEAAVTKRIKAVITHRKDKNDADKVYSGLAKIKVI